MALAIPDHVWDGFDERTKRWLSISPVPCPSCSGSDLDVLGNVVDCLACGYAGPMQEYSAEFMCDWREAVNDWNVKAGAPDHHGRSSEKLHELGLLPAYSKPNDPL